MVRAAKQAHGDPSKPDWVIHHRGVTMIDLSRYILSLYHDNHAPRIGIVLAFS
jgi:hypothetical protein